MPPMPEIAHLARVEVFTRYLAWGRPASEIATAGCGA
jgi:hypothetical protein